MPGTKKSPGPGRHESNCFNEEWTAWKLQKPLITVACNEDMTASDLTGLYLLDANGTRWVDGPLTIAARLRFI